MTANPLPRYPRGATQPRSGTVAPPTPEQEQQYIDALEKSGETQVRYDLEHGRLSEPFHDIVRRWLSERERSREAFRSEELALSRRDSAAAERQARAAESANTRATIAIIIAIASAIITAVNIGITYWLAHK
jgi:hypothetical protein